jgi:hypothetical protein
LLGCGRPGCRCASHRGHKVYLSVSVGRATAGPNEVRNFDKLREVLKGVCAINT